MNLRDALIAIVLIAAAIALHEQIDLLQRWRWQRTGRIWRALVVKLELTRDARGRFVGMWRNGPFVLERGPNGITVRVPLTDATLAGLTLFPNARSADAAPAESTAPAQARARALWRWFDSAPERWVEDGQLSAALRWSEVTPEAVRRLLEEMAGAQLAIAES